jgi:hypothetical protein
MNQESKGLTFRLPPETVAKFWKNTPSSSPGTVTGSDILPSSEDIEVVDDIKVVDEISSDPLPVISVDLERLIGYKPPLEEYDSIWSQLLGAMWTQFGGRQQQRQQDDDDANPSIPPPDFDLQVGELLGAGVATFGEKESCLQIKYPPVLQTSNNTTTATATNPREEIQTTQVWKDLLTHPTDLDFVAQL